MSDDYHDETESIPDHINDRNGVVSLFVMGMAIALLVLLVIAIAQAA